MKYVLIVAAGYLLGSINIGVLLSKSSFGDDVRRHGSGNAGATNMARVFGLAAGLLTLLGDMLKAVAAMYFGLALCGWDGLAVAGAACLTGHCWPVYYGFRGGKGVAVGAAAALMIDPWVFAAAIAVFAAVAFISKKVSFGSVCAAISVSVVSLALSVSGPRLILAFIVTAVVIYAHRPNIKRLIARTEPDFKLGGSK